MNEKSYRWIILGLSLVCIGLIVWLGLIYRDSGDTQDALAEAQSELDAANAGIARVEKELDIYKRGYNRLREQQLESKEYQQQLEDELERREGIIERLKSAGGDVADSSQRIEDIAREYADLIREGNEFIANGEK